VQVDMIPTYVCAHNPAQSG